MNILIIPIFLYVGPGLGAGTIATIIGVLVSLILALFALLWYPFKRLIKKIRASVSNRADNNVSVADE